MAVRWRRRGWAGLGVIAAGAFSAALMSIWGHWTSPGDVSIIDMPFLALPALLAVLMFCFGSMLRAKVARWGTRLVALPLAMLFVGALVNAHYQYLPTMSALFGRRAADQMSAAAFRRLESEAHTRARLEAARPTPAPPPLRSKGVVVDFDIPARASGFAARTAQVYLPPAWFQDPRPTLPVIELLHGSPGMPADWTRGAFADVTADGYSRTHNGVAPIIVMPDPNGAFWGDTECVNGPEGNVETYLTIDVRDAVVSRFGAPLARSYWAIAGLSEGGYCAAHLALRHPDMFAVAGNFSGDDHASSDSGIRKLFGGTWYQAKTRAREYDVRALIAGFTQTQRPALWFSAGRDDSLLARLRITQQMAVAAGFQTHLDTNAGNHSFNVWADAFRDALPWMMNRLQPPVGGPAHWAEPRASGLAAGERGSRANRSN